MSYAGKDDLQDEIFKKYHSTVEHDKSEDNTVPDAPDSEDIPVGGGQRQYESHRAPTSNRTPIRNGVNGGVNRE